MPASLLFVYGTLQAAFDIPQARQLRSGAKLLGRASFAGRLYDLGDYPGAVQSADPKERVWGELWQLTGNSDELLGQLDLYEESSTDFPEPREYERRLIEVTDAEGRLCRAWTWLYNRPISDMPLVPGGDYLRFRSPDKNPPFSC